MDPGEYDPLSVIRLPPEILMSPLPTSPSSINLCEGTVSISAERSRPAREIRAGRSRQSTEKAPASVCNISSTSPPNTALADVLRSLMSILFSPVCRSSISRPIRSSFAWAFKSQLISRQAVNVSLGQINLQSGDKIRWLFQGQRYICRHRKISFEGDLWL